ncbi:MAG: cupin-like domain-containing protein [Chitinophagaceae bacterium]|nr:cupin-like domain-containing protein [Chitinophagaceae bacterium]
MKMNIDTPIPVVDGTTITRKEFTEKYLKPQKPVILRGLWKQYPAYEKWTMDYFKQSMGDIKVKLFSTKQANPSETLSVAHAEMKFNEYLDLIEKEPTDLRLFLFPVFKHKPELLKDFGYPKITGRYIKIPFMFFGPKHSVTRMHMDIDMSNVFLTQFAGKRRVVLFPPDQSDFLYRLPFNVHGLVDIDKPDFETYPAMQHAKGVTGILEYGDTLYMPSGYWHHIEYAEGGFGLSVRTIGASVGTILTGLWNVTLQRKFDDIMFKIRGQKWFNYKKQLAFKRAEKAMKRVKENAVLQ